jgi:regulator of RNase E activity RraA
MSEATADKLLRVGGKRVLAVLAERGIADHAAVDLPITEPFAGPASLTIETCRAGSVLVGEATGRVLERLRQRGIAGVVSRSDLRDIPVQAGDMILRERNSLVAIPAALAGEVAEQAAEAVAFEDFTADQVAQGGGVYGLHLPSGDRAKQAFAAWRRMKGK